MLDKDVKEAAQLWIDDVKSKMTAEKVAQIASGNPAAVLLGEFQERRNMSDEQFDREWEQAHEAMMTKLEAKIEKAKRERGEPQAAADLVREEAAK
jgi:hypothetical protein